MLKLDNSDLKRSSTEFAENDLTRDWNSRLEAINELVNSLKSANGNQNEIVRLLLVIERVKTTLRALNSKSHEEFTNKEKLEEEEVERLLSGVEIDYPELYDISRRKER